MGKKHKKHKTEWRSSCFCFRKDPHGFFAFPVTDAIAPGYSMIIKHPMDFGTMKDKIVANEYKSVTEFKADFKLMCDNAMTYNRPDTVYYKLAKKILHAGFKMMSKERLLALKRSMSFMQDMDFSQQAALLGNEDTAVEEPVPEVVPVQVETAKKSKRPSREVISCMFEPEGNACSLTDSTAEEHVLALVEHAADEARDRINRLLPGGKVTGALFFFHFIVHLIATSLDPAEASIRLKNYPEPLPIFDSSKHVHVIENQYCHLCRVPVFFFGSVASALAGLLCLLVILLYVFIQYCTNPEELRTDPHYRARRRRPEFICTGQTVVDLSSSAQGLKSKEFLPPAVDPSQSFVVTVYPVDSLSLLKGARGNQRPPGFGLQRINNRKQGSLWKETVLKMKFGLQALIEETSQNSSDFSGVKLCFYFYNPYDLSKGPNRKPPPRRPASGPALYSDFLP
ncbi:hypothetical protein HPG69_017301 [Diceros bicornis minor]|uniref:Bromo domain-containing protein n=1 Tax=Diceros bicornis minor TaxID=77932 RepID=A0A7J7EF32_DICBM|nr:hypothetical protein HPG69_017301 [Diceros bicornis minor]